jgi:hypothetical protein
MAGMPSVAAAEASAVTPFSTAAAGQALPPPWRFTTLPGIKNQTRYSLVKDGQSVVVRADAAASMASIVHPLNLDAGRFPIVSWSWKISNVLRDADIRTKAGDDYPARFYVLFDYDTGKLSFMQRMKLAIARKRYGADVPTAALCYVWDGKAAAGTSAWSAYSDRVRMIVVESGTGNLDRWRSEERDVAADFRAAFGEEPPMVSGVAIVSDTDNTGESASAMFGDIAFRAAPK